MLQRHSSRVVGSSSGTKTPHGQGPSHARNGRGSWPDDRGPAGGITSSERRGARITRGSNPTSVMFPRIQRDLRPGSRCRLSPAPTVDTRARAFAAASDAAPCPRRAAPGRLRQRDPLDAPRGHWTRSRSTTPSASSKSRQLATACHIPSDQTFTVSTAITQLRAVHPHRHTRQRPRGGYRYVLCSRPCHRGNRIIASLVRVQGLAHCSPRRDHPRWVAATQVSVRQPLQETPSTLTGDGTYARTRSDDLGSVGATHPTTAKRSCRRATLVMACSPRATGPVDRGANKIGSVTCVAPIHDGSG
jgi:hypothetical protein